MGSDLVKRTFIESEKQAGKKPDEKTKYSRAGTRTPTDPSHHIFTR